MEYAKKLVGQFGARRLAIIGGSGLAAIVAVGLLVSQVGGSGEKAFLYTELDPQSAQMITEKLRGQGVEFELSPDGTAVMVPAEKVPELRMSLASEQIGGKIGYEILDNEEPFGTSASRAKLNETRAIEGELAQSIKSMKKVRDARVHLVMPERQLFADESRPASAAITVKTAGRLSGQQTDAIRYLVAAAVPELNPDRISIIDQNGSLLARAGDGSVSAGALDERKQSMENKLRENVEQMLERIVGPGHVRAQVVVDLNAQQVREESQTYDPDGQVVAKSTTVETSDESNERTSTGEVTVATQLPENQGNATGGAGDENRRAARETSEEVHYDNSKVSKTLVNPGGGVRRLTVSVMVDGAYTKGPDGQPVYAARSQAEIERFTRLVENAVGFDESRGDSVIVDNMQFQEVDVPVEEEPGFFSSMSTSDLITKIILGILALVAIVMFARHLKQKKQAALEGPLDEIPLLNAADIDPMNMTDEKRALLARAAAGDEDAMREIAALSGPNEQLQLDHEIDVAQVNGRLKANVLRRVGDVITESTPEAASVVRQWMNAG